MRKLLFSFLSFSVIAFTACNNNDSESNDHHISPTNDPIDVIKVNTPENEAANASVKEVIDSYLEVKGALSKDQADNSSASALALVEALEDFDVSTLTEEEVVTYNDFAQVAKDIANQIYQEEENITNQRNLFIELSLNFEGFIKNFGTGGQALYKDYCPMVNDDTGAAWFSEVENIENPYFGASMFACGVIQEKYEE